MNVHGSLCKVPHILVRFQLNLNFLNIFWIIPQISSFMEIRAVGADKLLVAFRNFANVPNRDSIIIIIIIIIIIKSIILF
jgi:hypothetical protein